METQIKKLIELAHEYHRVMVECNLPDNWQVLKYETPNGIWDIAFYFQEGKREWWQVKLYKFTVTAWSDIIEMPANSTAETLEQTYIKASEFLAEFSESKAKEFIDKAAELKAKQIAELEAQLTALKGGAND